MMLRTGRSVLVEQLNAEGWARTYLIVCESTHLATLVDPVWDNIERDMAILSGRSLNLAFVLGTHTHADHISAGWELARRNDCDFIMFIGADTHGVTRFVNDLEELEMGEVCFRFHAAPGHTADSMIIEVAGYIMTGDFLFNGAGGAGRDDLPGGDTSTHWDALAVLDRFEGETMVLSGHDPPGNEPGCLDWNRDNNPALCCSSYEEYESWQRAEWQRLGSVSRMPVALPANLSGKVPDEIPWLQ